MALRWPAASDEMPRWARVYEDAVAITMVEFSSALVD